MSLSNWCSTISLTSKSSYIPGSEEARLIANDKTANWKFGASDALDSTGTRCIVGSPGADVSTTGGAGVAYIFVRSGTSWTQEAILNASDKAANDQFGKSVSISDLGDRIVVGAWMATVGSFSTTGAAYLFTCSGTTWTQQAKLVASAAGNSDNFAESCSITPDGSRILIGAKLSDPSSLTSAGSAFVYK